MDIERLIKQVDFINEIEKLKLILRANGTLDPNRRENSAEHSWHVSVMAILMVEHAPSDKVELLKVVKMLLIHDIVEIDAGDTWAYDENQKSKFKHELAAANRIFSLLPSDQSEDFIKLWMEFEARESPEAKFAHVIDGLQPLINHLLTGDRESLDMKISADKVRRKKAYIEEICPSLWAFTEGLIQQSVSVGLYSE